MKVLVTGAASGIGRAVAAELRRQGEEVAGLDIQSAPDVFVADVRDQQQVDTAVAVAVGALGASTP